MLEIENLHVKVAGNELLRDINLRIGEGETHMLFGPNGSGKTSLMMAIMGFSNYEITQGEIRFKGQLINHLPINERALMGVGISFQRPPTVRGVTTRQMVKISSRNGDNIEKLAFEMDMLEFLDRDINLGFSGGEMKRSELLQLMAQSPDLVLLDEPESGVDLENMVLVGKVVRALLEKNLHRLRKRSGLIITHTGYILDYLEGDKGHVMIDGTVVCTGNPREMIEQIRKVGYEECAACQK